MAPAWPIIVGVQLATAAVAGFGAWRAASLHGIYPDRRLTRLSLFFGLFAAAVAVHAVGGAQIWLSGAEGPLGPPPGAPPPPPGAPRMLDLANPLSWHVPLHHALLLAALVVGVVAFTGTRAGATTALILPAFLVPGATLLEALLSLYVAARGAWNHYAVRRTRGSLRVAVGFGLFFLGHLAFYLLREPGAPRPLVGEFLALAGVLVLATALPRRRVD